MRWHELGTQWIAFSPASGETHLLNDTGAALLQILAREGPLDLEAIVVRLGEELGNDSGRGEAAAEIEALQSSIAQSLCTFAEAALVCRCAVAPV